MWCLMNSFIVFYKGLCRRRWTEHHLGEAGILSRKTTDWFCETTGWNSATGRAAMLLIIIVLLHTSLILALVFMVIWLIFLLKGLCRKLVLFALVSCWYTCFVYAQILFCRTFQVQEQNKQTRDLSSSNRGRLLNKMLWCLQIQDESLKTLLLGVCVLSSFLKLVNSLLKLIQVHLNL